jgi:hypothetical protein
MREASAVLLGCALAAMTIGCGSGDSDQGTTSVGSIPSITQPELTQPSTSAAKPRTPRQGATTTSADQAPAAGTGEQQASIDSCPPRMSRRDCRELAQALEEARGSSSSRPLRCAQLGKDLCDEIMRQLGRHP